MASPEYFRKQAEICVRLADAAGGAQRAMRFKLLASDLLAKAAGATSTLDQADAAPDGGRRLKSGDRRLENMAAIHRRPPNT